MLRSAMESPNLRVVGSTPTLPAMKGENYINKNNYTYNATPRPKKECKKCGAITNLVPCLCGHYWCDEHVGSSHN